jgi:8-oxoguanine deaminase
MSTLLVKNAHVLITMNDRRQAIPDGGLFVRDNVIEQVGSTAGLPGEADVVIDAAGAAVLPGLVNTHHHFFQTLTRCIPGAQDHEFFDWWLRLLPIFGEMTDEAVQTSSLTAMAELILSGCTTTSDQHYIYANDITADAQVRAAREIGMRFHLARGGMVRGRSQGGLPPDELVETEDQILRDSQRLIETYHDPGPFAMIRVALAPAGHTSVTKAFMKETARLARSYKNVGLHTHVAETLGEVAFLEREFGLRPVPLMVEAGWVGPDVWWAHTIHVNADEIRVIAETGTGVAHCPMSNMRVSSGICPVREMLDAGVKIGLGTDGSASNDYSNLLEEARSALLLQRVVKGPAALTALESLEMATRGGASVLGRDDIGSLEAGKAADFVGIPLDTLNMAGGAVHDPVAALVFCRTDRVRFSVINGRPVVLDGRLLTVDEDRLVRRHNKIAVAIASTHPYGDIISKPITERKAS